MAMLVVNFSHAIATPVLLHGSCSDSSISEVNIVSYSPFWDDDQPIVWGEAVKNKDNVFDISFDPERSTQMYFMIIGYTWVIYVTPGDTVEFTITSEHDDLSIVFTGKNATHYNYDPQLQKVNDGYLWYKRFDDLKAYKAAVEAWYEREEAFFQQYRKTHTLNKDFMVYAQSLYTYGYVRDLYNPLVYGEVRHADLPQHYLADAENISFQKDQLLAFAEFRRALSAKYILSYGMQAEHALEQVYKNILTTFVGKTKAFLLTDMIGIYAKREEQAYKEMLPKIAEASKAYITDPIYINYIHESILEYELLDKQLPDDVLDNTHLLSIENNQQVLLRDLLKKFDGKAVYIDFWASWCSPCIIDIENSEETKKFLASNEVVYLYLSLDENQDIQKWKKIAEKKGVTEHQYIVSDDFDSPIAAFLDIHEIPRYVILGKDHTIKTFQAPRPTPPQFEDLKARIKEATAEVFRYE